MKLKRILCAALLLLALVFPLSAQAAGASFTYTITMTDQNGVPVADPRALPAGSRLNVEIELRRTDTNEPLYYAYGLEFRLESQGLSYNYDGSSFRSGVNVTQQFFDSGPTVGFAYYDMQQQGVAVNNPLLVGSWSYTVENPSTLSITVPVALVYVTGDTTDYRPDGTARLSLEPNGGTIRGEDVSGDYPSGTPVTLPGAERADYIFRGWSDGARLYGENESVAVTGIITLVARWEEPVKNRQVLFEPNGGMIAGDDPGGMYADGEVIVIPGAEREGYTLTGWTMGGSVYAAGESYTVDNSVVFVAEWAESMSGPENTVSALPAVLSVLAALGPGWWLILVFGKRYVRYGMKDGGVKLSYRDRKSISYVRVFMEVDGTEVFLDQSGEVEIGKKLTLINGTHVLDTVHKGFYQGRLHVTYKGDREARDIKVRIHAKDTAYNEDWQRAER